MKHLSQNIPVLYCVFQSFSGGSDIRDPTILYEYIMDSIRETIRYLGSDYKVSDYLNSNWNYERSKDGLLQLFDDLHKEFGKKPSLIIDEAQAVRGVESHEARGD